MTGHVTYACNCLNVKIHLANKYYLEGHEKFRNGKFTRLEEPPITGWKFELSMDGVKVEYANLIRLRIIMDNPEGWITISCHNCSTGDVYSVKRPNTKINYPFNDSILSKFGDQVIIHKGTVFGSEIEKLQKKATYSSTFHIILNPDLPIDHVSQENEDTLSPELKNQHKQVQQLLKQSLINLEEITEKKIQAFQKEQEILLVREKEKATYDSAILWQRMKEIAKTVKEEEHRVRRLDYHKTKNGVTDQILFNRIISDEEQDQTIHDTSLDDIEKEMRKGESHVHFSHDYSFEPETDQRRRSSAFKRDLFGGFTCPSHGNRRSSYVLDESAIANSFKKAHHLDPVSEMPQFHRRCSSLVPPSSQHHHHHNLHPSTESNNNLHPLAQPKTSTDSTAATMPTSSNTSSSWEDDEDNTKKSDDDSEEELFPLDEDIDKLNEHSLPTTSQNRRPSSALKGKRKPSNKYIEFEEDHDEKEKEQQESWKYLMKTSQHAKQQDHNFATSVPITINHPPAFSVKNKMENMQSSVQKYPSSSFIQEPTHFNPTATGRKPSFIGFDYAEADRRASLKFPPLDDQRSSIVTTLNHTLSSHHYHHHHHHRHHHNNNTQHLSSNKNKIELELDQDDIEPDEDGPMIPPHILAANTVTDETEALFGSVPHNSIRNRPLE